ncbi:MAG: CopD family protein [Caulobacterales bacterium]|uniref:CopD family protein n=1 Tax=Glycocaulis sp. TaxID=1969725 RepID=UPI003F9F8196
MLIALKSIHILAITLWAGGLIALPVLLRRDNEMPSRAAVVRLHHFSRFAHDALVSPAAVIAIASGISLIFFVPAQDWLFLKLAAVSAMAGIHMLVARVLDQLEAPGARPTPLVRAGLLTGACVTSGAVLLLVLGRPDLPDGWMPGWLLQGQEGELPFISEDGSGGSSSSSTGREMPT